VLFFFSSAFFPLELMDGWFQEVASANPLSSLIDGLRHQIVFGADAGQFLTALAVAGGVFVVGVGLAGVALRARLARGS
jgi:ABC-type polysaccharide/polyol phosphate export permease